MLNSNDLLQKMVKHFPRWMDIRKRVNKSSGGQLLNSIADEIAEVQDAINEYKKDFFIDRYEGREDDIIAFVYKAHIGLINLTELSIVEPDVELTEDLKDFYESNNKAFYENGYLYFKTEDIENNGLNKIKYKLQDYTLTSNIEKMHVWNVFDEFATFMGIERHLWETNSQLVERILMVKRRPTNSSEVGLQNAILNELMHIDKELSIDEIKIEGVTPENLIKYYKEFGSIIEKLAHVNRDIYRTKRWDIDTWQYKFKSIDYIPHAWDVAIEAYQNGIGFDKDLEVVLTNVNDHTNATVTLYEESQANVLEYIKNKDIKQKVDLELSRYNNYLNPVTLKYRITASEVKNITNNPIAIECSEKISGTHERYIQHLIDNSITGSKDIEIVDNGILQDGKNYKLVFNSKVDYGKMNIDTCKLILTTGTNSIEQVLVENYTHPSTKLYVSQKYQYTNTTNIVNAADGGVMVDDISIPSEVSVELNNIRNQFIKIEHDCQMGSIPRTAFIYNGFQADENGKATSLSASEERFFEINIQANKVSFNIEGPYIVQTEIDGISRDPVIGFGALNYSTEKFDTPRSMKIRVYSNSKTNITTAYNFRFSSYEISTRLQFGSIGKTDSGLLLPDYNLNNVYISLKANTIYSPIIRYVYIGNSLNGAKYETPVIQYIEGQQRKVVIESNCNVSLIEVDSNGNALNTINNFDPHPAYKAKSDQAYIKIDLSRYTSINSIKTNLGKLETTGSNNNISYYIYLKKDESISKISIDGEILVPIKTYALNDIINANPSAGDIVYCNNLMQSFIIVNGNNQRKVTVTPDMISAAGDSFKFINLPDDVACAFISSDINKSLIIADSFIGKFKSVYLFPKNCQTYIAYNQVKMVKQDLDNIDIVNVFQPFIPANQNMIYNIEDMTPTSTGEVKFDMPNTDFIVLNKWSVGRRKLRAHVNMSMTDNIVYNLDKKYMNKEFSLRNIIKLDRNYTLSTGEIIDLAQYMIKTPEGMKLNYKTRPVGSLPEQVPEFYYSESFYPDDDGFNKLNYANIDEIIYIGTTPYNPDNPSQNAPIPQGKYTLLDKGAGGILIWNTDEFYGSGYIIYIVYTIKIPDYIAVNTDILYKAVEYKVEAYKQVSQQTIENIKDGYVLDLKQYPEYKNTSKVTIFCSSPGFLTKFENDKITFTRFTTESVVAVKTGFYYYNGDEYYLFADKVSDNVDSFKNVNFYNVDRLDGEMTLNKRTSNYIKNSYMELSGMSDVFSMEFNSEQVKGISSLNSITACDSFNHWITFGTSMSLLNGYNGLGIDFKPLIQDGYAYIDITQYLFKDNFLSLNAKGNIQAFIGKEIKFQNSNLHKSTIMELPIEIKHSIIEPEMMECRFTPAEGYKYYLVIKGQGTIDDIIMKDAINHTMQKDMHKKNIDYLNIRVEEKIMNDYKSRLFLDDNRGSKCEGAEFNREGVIVNSKLVDWGLTLIKSFCDAASWKKCTMEKINFENDVISTLPKAPGRIITDSIYLTNTDMIKTFIVKINDVMFDSMKGFTIKILSSKTYNGEYRTIKTFTNNVSYISGKFLYPYVKVEVSIPGGKIINNIDVYVEYKTTEKSAPVESTVLSGTFMTKVLDTHYTAKYKVDSIGIDSISNIKDVDIEIRGAKENYNGEVWSSWKPINIDSNFKILNNITFDGYRFFQIRLVLKRKDANIKLKYVDLGVIQ